MTGALAGVRVVEFAGLGPGPFAGMMLADHGAEVICIQRPGALFPGGRDKAVLNRSRSSLVLDLRLPEAVSLASDIISKSDALIEGFRPGVMEKLGLGPEEMLQRQPSLVYGRMTGWGQSGPLASLAGHDINYIAMSGALHACRRAGGPPTPPVNFLGDFGGGGMLLAFGIVAGILSARSTGRGQVLDAAMVDGSALLMSMMWGMRAQLRWNGPPGTNFLDTGAHFYDTYETADGEHIAFGAVEPKFYAEMLAVLGFGDDDDFQAQSDSARWPRLKEKIAVRVKSRSRAEWVKLFEGRDACFSPVLSLDEAAADAHNVVRNTFVEAGGVQQPAPAPRFLGSGSRTPQMPPRELEDASALLQRLGYDVERTAELKRLGAVA